MVESLRFRDAALAKRVVEKIRRLASKVALLRFVTFAVRMSGLLLILGYVVSYLLMWRL